MLQICFLLICSNSKFWNVIQRSDNEKSIGMDHTLQYCSQKLLAINMILRAKARCRGRGPSEMSFVGHWVQRDISSKKRRKGQGRPCCWCPCTRKRSPLHLLPSLLTLGWRTRVINPQRKKAGMIHFCRHIGNKALKHAVIQRNCSACCHLYTAGGKLLAPFFFLLLFDFIF